MADASLIFHSAKTSTRWGDQDFFALSAYGFKTAVSDQKDAYTILSFSDEIVNSRSAVAAVSETKESEDSKVDWRQGKEYFLWELSSG